jgi:hypothetical protein
LIKRVRKNAVCECEEFLFFIILRVWRIMPSTRRLQLGEKNKSYDDSQEVMMAKVNAR